MSTGLSTSITDTIGATGIGNQMTWIVPIGRSHLPGVLLVCKSHGEQGCNMLREQGVVEM